MFRRPVSRIGALAARAASAACVVAIACAAVSSSARACPQNCIWTPNGGDYCTPVPALDTMLTVDPGGLCSGYHHAAYSIPLGTLVSESGSPFGGCLPRTTVDDDFTLVGPPPGTPVSLTARLGVSTMASAFLGDGTVQASIREGAANQASLNWDILKDIMRPGPDGPLYDRSTTLSVVVAAVAGTPFHMRFSVGADLAGELTGAQTRATWTFDGLPNGAAVVSCNDFVLGPVPARPASWGSLKARYR